VFATHLSHNYTDYAAKADRGDMLVVPTRETLIRCLLTDSVNDCSESDVNNVTFFYKVALMTVEGKLLKSKSLMDKKDVWGALDKGMHWSSSMAYSLMLVEKMSDLTNIAHNYQVKRRSKGGGGAGEEESATTSDGGDIGTGTNPEEQPAKKLKKKIRVKGSMDGIVVAFYENNQAFRMARMTKDKVARSRLRRRLMAWEKKVNIIGNNGASAAWKRRSFEPLTQQQPRNKVPKNLMNFGSRMSMMDEVESDADYEDDNEELVPPLSGVGGYSTGV
jgi:hypothetical protein